MDLLKGLVDPRDIPLDEVHDRLCFQPFRKLYFGTCVDRIGQALHQHNTRASTSHALSHAGEQVLQGVVDEVGGHEGSRYGPHGVAKNGPHGDGPHGEGPHGGSYAPQQQHQQQQHSSTVHGHSSTSNGTQHGQRWVMDIFFLRSK
jgi:hypothetical protein